MDIKKIGEFIARLRNENKMTQIELGEKLGVTNKTISRWENGKYMPSIEMLEMLSKEFDVSINEIISGERIVEDNYKDEAEKNIISALKANKFSIKEKQEYLKTQWIKSNIPIIVI